MNFGYTQIFRNGILEATKTSIISENEGVRRVSIVSLEQQIFEVLPGYIQGLRNIAIPPPVVVMITLEGVEGAIYATGKQAWEATPPAIDRPILFLPECIINEYGTEIDCHRAMKPAFDALWNAADYPSAKTFSEDGQWIGNQQRS